MSDLNVLLEIQMLLHLVELSLALVLVPFF